MALHPERFDQLQPDALSAITFLNFDLDLSGVIPHIARLTGLRRLEFRYCILNDSALQPLARLKNLKHLELTGSGIKGPCFEEIKKISSLESFFVDFNRLDQHYVQCLAQLPKLVALHLGHTGLTDDALAAIAKEGRS